MTLEVRNEIIVIPVFAITTAFESCGVDLCLRYGVGRIHVLRMTVQPLLYTRWHRWLLRLLRLWLFGLLQLLAGKFFCLFHLSEPRSQSRPCRLIGRAAFRHRLDRPRLNGIRQLRRSSWRRTQNGRPVLTFSTGLCLISLAERSHFLPPSRRGLRPWLFDKRLHRNCTFSGRA